MAKEVRHRMSWMDVEGIGNWELGIGNWAILPLSPSPTLPFSLLPQQLSEGAIDCVRAFVADFGVLD
ncbi:hypothetical protein IQ270_23450 [Microcoleus sp. LEGE 07076]|uniref:hypothetical protein n=1 Tax=Microcoleus sp. LEGE 07076 TaxID=915322 RepID=UPI00187F5E42|nr:hypothetical protein [Microcoleus sp. LEGE 07076]MBE9187520.1 hypothetical protein [Microcoleus sp. LEGE 07076]